MSEENGNRKWHLKNMRWITNKRFKDDAWLSNICKVRPKDKHYSSTIKLIDSTNLNNFKEILENVFNGKNIAYFTLMNGDVVNEIDFNIFFQLSNYAKRNNIKINLRKGKIIDYGKKYIQITKNRSH